MQDHRRPRKFDLTNIIKLSAMLVLVVALTLWVDNKCVEAILGYKYSLAITSNSVVERVFTRGRRVRTAMPHRGNINGVDTFPTPLSACIVAVKLRGRGKVFVISHPSCQASTTPWNVRCRKSVRGVRALWYRRKFNDRRWPRAVAVFRNDVPNHRYWSVAGSFCPQAYWVRPRKANGRFAYCRMRIPKVHGGWSDWAPAACQTGQQQRRRCNNPAQKCGGKRCQGPSIRVCPLVPCADLTPTLARNVSLGGYVYAVTTLGDEVFAKKYDERNAVRVYDAATLAFKRSLSIPGLGYTDLGLVASDRDNHLYVTDYEAGKVFKVQLPNGPATMEWNVGSYPTGIAINRAQNLIVNIYGEDTIKEYTPNGTLVSQVSLPSSFNLHDVAQLPNGQILVSNYGTPNHILAVVEADGTVVTSYTGSSLSRGRGFDVFENGYIIAADMENNRMLIVNPTLTSAQQLPVLGLSSPYSVAIDESRGRVYIGEGWGGDRLVMLENVFGRCLAF